MRILLQGISLYLSNGDFHRSMQRDNLMERPMIYEITKNPTEIKMHHISEPVLLMAHPMNKNY